MERKILVVANRTADSPDLIAALRERAAEEKTVFTLLVPADGWPGSLARAERAGGRVRRAGLDLEEVIVGDPALDIAIGDVLHVREFGEVMFEGDRDRELLAA